MLENLAIPQRLIGKADLVGAYYMRVSTQEQAHAKADPLGRQRLNLDLLGKILGHPEDDHIYIDRQSGKRDDRPQLQALLALVESKIVDWVACDRIDRIGRSVEHNMKLWKLFAASGVQLFIFEWGKFVNFSPYEGSEDWDPFVRDSIRAEQESRIKGKRSYAAHRYSRHLRKANYVLPFGYIRDDEGRTFLDPGQFSERHSILDIAIARRDLYLELGTFRGAVIPLLERYNHKVSPRGLATWLCNPILRGHTPRYVNSKTSLPEFRYADIDYNTHPDQIILTEPQYQRILELRRNRGGSRTQAGKRPAPLAGLCRCALCGYTLTLSKWRGKNHENWYLACHGRRLRYPDSGCWKIPQVEWGSIRYEVVEDSVLLALSKKAQELTDQILDPPDEDAEPVSSEDLKVISQIAQLERLQREIVGSDFTKDIERLRAKIEKPVPRKPNQDLAIQLKAWFSVTGKGSMIAMLSDTDKYDLLHRFVEVVTIDRKRIVEIRLRV